MGAWTFLSERIAELLAEGQRLTCVARAPSPSPAAGYHKVHQAEQDAIVEQALKVPARPLEVGAEGAPEGA